MADVLGGFVLGIGGNLVTKVIENVLKQVPGHHAHSLLETLGFQEKTFVETLKQILEDAKNSFNKDYPEYQIAGINKFFEDEKVIDHITKYILSGDDIESKTLVPIFEKYAHSLSLAKRSKQKGSEQYIADLLLAFQLSYEGVLLRNPETSVISAILKINRHTTTVKEEFLKALYTRDYIQIIPIEDNSKSIFSGWDKLSKDFIRDREQDNLDDALVNYYDGGAINWSLIFSKRIPRRRTISKIVGAIENYSIVALICPGGEGKTTALRQALYELTNKHEDWLLLWRIDRDIKFNEDFHKKITPFLEKNKTILLCIDDAALIALNIYKYIKSLASEERKNIKFLVSSRDTDWINASAVDIEWDYFGNSFFTKMPMDTLDHLEATKIIQEWNIYSDRGTLGDLLPVVVSQGIPEAARKLVEATEQKKGINSGAFLGALLWARGEILYKRVENILLELGKHSIGGETTATLKDVYAYIAIPHALGLFSLSSILLSHVLSIPLKTNLLGDEITVHQYILTRHRVIADSVLAILEEENNRQYQNVYRKYLKSLLRSVAELRDNGKHLPEIDKWRFFPTQMFRQGEAYHNIAIELAEAVVDGNPKDGLTIVQLANLYRDNGEPEYSSDLFRTKTPEDCIRHRGFYAEWARAELDLNSIFDAIYLGGVSLSDRFEKEQYIDLDRLHISVNTVLLTSFQKATLENAHLNKVIKILTKLNKSGFKKNSISATDFDIFVKSIKDSFVYLSETMPPWVSAPEELTFESLKKRLFT